MLDNKTRSEILLEEKVAKIDDINFDKIYDVDEFATKQLETFEDTSEDLDNLSSNKIESFEDEKESNNSAFELELQPNEFLDNMVWGEDDEIEEINKKRKFNLTNKPLFYAFTSIVFLLCILFIYNVFVIKSLEGSIASSASSTGANITITENIQNNDIVFENGASTQIETSTNYNKQNKNINNFQTNWFNELCTRLNQLFGGNY